MTTLSLVRPARLAGVVFAALMVAACAGVPAAPLAATPAVETGPGFRALTGTDAPSAGWWTGFDDPELQRLVETALKASPVLRGADYSVAEAEALLRLALLGRSPSLTGSASAAARRPTGGADDFEASGDAGLAAGWELDAFGRLGAAIEAARYDETAARELRRDLAVTVASETALAYIDLRSAEARLSVAQANAAAQKDSLDLVQTLFDNGRANELDLNRAEAQYRTTLASLPVFRATIASARNRLAALTGAAATLPAPVTSLDGERVARIPRLTASLSAGAHRRRPSPRRSSPRQPVPAHYAQCKPVRPDQRYGRRLQRGLHRPLLWPLDKLGRPGPAPRLRTDRHQRRPHARRRRRLRSHRSRRTLRGRDRALRLRH